MEHATNTQVAADTIGDGEQPRAVVPRWGVFVIGLVAAAIIVGVAIWQVGPSPAAVDAGLPKDPPPLALPSDEAETSALSAAAALLARGDLDLARAAFIDVVANDPDGVAGQVGLILSRWNSTGPRSVERDLRQLTLEYPEEALALVHLGLVQTLLGDAREARATMQSAVDVGRAAADTTSLRMARIADDLLHPGTFRGPLPVLVTAQEVEQPQRADVRELLAAVTADDRVRAMAAAGRLEDTDDPMARVAAIAAAYDKRDPEAVPRRLDALARGKVPTQVADRARFLAGLATLWGGEDRDGGCRRLARSTQGAVDAATQRLAAPIHAELCGNAPVAGSED